MLRMPTTSGAKYHGRFDKADFIYIARTTNTNVQLENGQFTVTPTHFLTRRLPNVGTEMSLNVLAYNLARVLRILGFRKTMQAMRLVGA
jgi:hypothetical protein